VFFVQVEKAKEESVPIKVILPDGSEKPGIKLVTTPMDIIKGISKSLANNAVVAKVDGQIWDLFRPLEGDCALQVFSFEDPEGKEVRGNP
jgi:threonyl-tRNA synthetase